MSEIEIPNRFIPGFHHLTLLPDEKFEMLARGVQNVSPGISFANFEKYLKEILPIPSIDDIAKTIISVGTLYSNWETTKAELAHDLAVSFASKSTNGHGDTLEKRLGVLFNNFENLAVSFKAFDLLGEVDKVFKRTRVVTDLRLVFGDKISSKNRTALILHQMKIEYVSASEGREFYVAMDKNDLLELKRQVERALEKEETIRTDYGDSLLFIEV